MMRRSRRGFASLMAIGLVAFVSMALVAMSVLMAGEIRRTRDGAACAQLGQLLLAGALDARVHARSWGASAPAHEAWTIELPPPLRDCGAALTASAGGVADKAEVRIDASLDRLKSHQIVRFTRQGETWQITDTILDP